MPNNNIIVLSEKFDTPKTVHHAGWMESFDSILVSGKRMKLKDKMTFYRLLATMVNAWLTVLQAIKILHAEQKNPSVKKIEAKMIENIHSGKNLSATLKEFPKSFWDAEIAMVESWEKTGKLNITLLEIASQIEKLSSLKRKMIGALVYPALIVLVMIGVLFVVMWKVVPPLVALFSDFWGLPTSTQMLVSISNFTVDYWYVLIGLPFVFGFIWRSWRKTEWGLFVTDRFILRIPGVGSLMKKMLLARFSRLIASLMGSGISIVESLRIIAGAMGNEVYRQRIMLLRDDVMRGVTMWKSLEWDPLFPDMVTQMIKVGEETAKIDSIIVKVADFYDEEVDVAVSAINKIIEPVIIVVMAIWVWLIAYAILTPIMRLSDVIVQ
jgi:type IV pilus assembly protein PilC